MTVVAVASQSRRTPAIVCKYSVQCDPLNMCDSWYKHRATYLTQWRLDVQCWTALKQVRAGATFGLKWGPSGSLQAALCTQ